MLLNTDRHRSSGKYLLLADISEFYRSVYTHGLAWAIHGRATAKKNRSDSLFGNLLDKLLRNTQDAQTNGIPIGPDTSLIVAETILSAVDRELIRGHSLNGFRYYDDYELSFRTYSEAEAILTRLQLLLGEYGLQVNPLKTRIVELPFPMDLPWTHQTRRVRISDRKGNARVVSFFERIFELKMRFPQAHVLGYAMKRIESQRWAEQEWPLVESLLLQCLVIEPSAMQQFARAIAHAAIWRLPLNKSRLSQALSEFIVAHAISGDASELSWALWLCLYLGLSIDAVATHALSNVRDSFVAILALDARSRSILASNDLETLEWSAELTHAGLFGEQWLLAYEAAKAGWLGPRTHLISDPFFQALDALNVRFYEPVVEVQEEDEFDELFDEGEASEYGGDDDGEVLEDEEPEDDEPDLDSENEADEDLEEKL